MQPLAKLYAQLLVAQQRDREAIDLLQRALPGAAQDAEYHALLAGVYQADRARQPQPSSTIKQRWRLSPDHGEWWMGLGISQEQAGRTDTCSRNLQTRFAIPAQGGFTAIRNHAYGKVCPVNTNHMTTIMSRNRR